MQEYRDVRKHHSLVEICKKPELAADVTITAAEFLKVDAAIIFADLLLPLEVMGLPFHFSAGEGPVIEKPVRTAEDVSVLRTDRAAELGYVADAVALVVEALRSEAADHRLLRRAVHPGQLHGRGRRVAPLPGSEEADVQLARGLGRAGRANWSMCWRSMRAEQVRAGADAVQIFDSWVGCLSVEDYRRYALRADHAADSAPAERDEGAHHLFRHRQRDAAAVDGGDRRRGHRPGLAHSARRGLARRRTQPRGAGQSRSGDCCLPRGAK